MVVAAVAGWSGDSSCSRSVTFSRNVVFTLPNSRCIALLFSCACAGEYIKDELNALSLTVTSAEADWAVLTAGGCPRYRLLAVMSWRDQPAIEFHLVAAPRLSSAFGWSLAASSRRTHICTCFSRTLQSPTWLPSASGWART